MKKRSSDNMWIPFWIDKWIFGSMRIECTLEERAVWIDLLALAAKDNGFIRANEKIPYPPQQLAGMLMIPEDILEKSIEKFIETKKLKRLSTGVLYVTTWEKYQFSDRYRRMFKHDSSAKTERVSKKRQSNKIKEKKIKENNNKSNKKIIELSPWIPQKEFLEYKRMRQKIKKPMTTHALELAIKKLEQLKNEGHDPKKVLEQSILNSWQGLFPLKDDKKSPRQLRQEEAEKEFLSKDDD